jgi:hypothetical protein
MRFGILLLVVAALVVLVLFLGKGPKANPVSQGMAALEKAKTATLEMDMNSVSDAITAYFGDTNEYPVSLEALVPRYLPSENSLIDSWGTPFQLETDGQQNVTLASAGPDRVHGTDDDIKRRL